MTRSGKTFISVAFSCIWLHFPLPEPSSSAFSQGEKGFAGGQGCEGPAFAGRRVESLLRADEGAIPGTEWLSGVVGAAKLLIRFHFLPFRPTSGVSLGASPSS